MTRVEAAKERKKLNSAEASLLCSFDEMLEEIVNSARNENEVDNFERAEQVIRGQCIKEEEFIYEGTQGFSELFGEFLRAEKCDFFDEVHTSKYYLRRYKIGHITDPFYDKDTVNSFLSDTAWELGLKWMGSECLLLPEKAIALYPDLGQAKIDWKVKTPYVMGARWIYKCYRKQVEGQAGPFSLGDRLANVSLTEKSRLLLHYFIAIRSLLQNNIFLDRSSFSLKVYKLGDIYTGVLGIRNGFEKIQKADVLNILGEFWSDFSRLREMISGSGEGKLLETIKTIIDSLPQDDKRGAQYALMTDINKKFDAFAIESKAEMKKIQMELNNVKDKIRPNKTISSGKPTPVVPDGRKPVIGITADVPVTVNKDIQPGNVTAQAISSKVEKMNGVVIEFDNQTESGRIETKKAVFRFFQSSVLEGTPKVNAEVEFEPGSTIEDKFIATNVTIKN